MPEYITIRWRHLSPPTGEKCVVCGFPLNKAFPEDFPDNFKFCCTCKAIAFAMVRNDLPNELWILYRVDKIKKIITLVG